MRIAIQQRSLIISTLFVVFFLLPHSVRADAGEDYYKELRKLKKYDSASLDRIRKETVDAEQIKKVNALARANYEHRKKIEAKNAKKPVYTDEQENRAPKTGPNGEKAGPPRILDKPGKKVASSPSKISSSNADPKPAKKEIVKKVDTSTPSGPIKVDSNTPDELTFPGTNEE